MQNPIIQQVVETLRGANNVLITVKNSPSVDELTASIALTLILNHMNKHATTVFSGKVPSTIEFLQPEMAIESNTDSLRDFIIALDKSKADKLRYKVEDNVVRIFITPYKSSISEADLEFSQGDFNVDVVVALGVLTSDDFDQAVMAHGRILHDATVVAIVNQELQQEVGVVNWQDPQASSISEMIAQITDLFGTNVMDSQIATALMTGIVAETDRFKNEKTTPQVLAISSTLMTEGANQVLIAEELEQPVASEETMQPLPLDSQSSDGQSGDGADGMLSVPHEQEASVGNINIDEQGNIDTFGAVGQPQDHQAFPVDPALAGSEGGAAEDHGTLPELPATPLSQLEETEMQHDEPLLGAPPSDQTVVPERPYLEDPAVREHSDEEPLSEPSGLFGDSMHSSGAPSTNIPTMFGHTPKVLQPLGEAVDDAGAQPEAPIENTPPLQQPNFSFGDSGHTADMPGEYQAVASDPIVPYAPPASSTVDSHDDHPQAGGMVQTASDQPSVDLPDVNANMPSMANANDKQTLEDIERKVQSKHIEESAGLPKPPGTVDADGEHSVSDFIGSVRAPQPASEAHSPESNESANVPPPLPLVDANPPSVEPVQQIPAPAPIVVEPYQPPAPLHELNTNDGSAPPQVPPPLTMPQSTNHIEFYEPDGTKKNPFANPS